MKIFICSLLLCCLLAYKAQAQTGEESKIVSASNDLNKAILDADKNALQSITADELTYGHSSGKVESKEQFISTVLNGSFDFLSITIADQTIKVVGDLAMERHVLNARITNDGKPGELKLGVLLIWQKQKGNWKLVARQAVKL